MTPERLTDEMVEAAAGALWNRGEERGRKATESYTVVWWAEAVHEGLFPDARRETLDEARAALEAALEGTVWPS